MDDLLLRKHIIDELEFEPMIDAANIGVAVERGVAMLTGHVGTFAEKSMIEDVVYRIKGVKGIAEEIEVRPEGAHRTADDEIAKRAVHMIAWSTVIPEGSVQVKVQKGWITLRGKVEWQYQKKAAAVAVGGLAGVAGINNLIEVAPHATAQDVRKRIEEALQRTAEVEAKSIRVEVQDGKVTLEGHVNARPERKAAERAAWSVPGVTAVIDHISVA